MIKTLLSTPCPIHAKSITYPGRTMTWAGPGLTSERFLFGSEDGYIYESGTESALTNSHLYHAMDRVESVNGIAHTIHGGVPFVAVSTRAEIKIHRFGEENRPASLFGFDFGSHGIYPTAHKGFLAPLGPDGIIAIRPGSKGNIVSKKLVDSSEKPYYYKLASLGQYGVDGKEIFVGACRKDGITVIELAKDHQPTLVKRKAAGFDVVDVCSIGNTSYPRAMVALGRDRSMHFTLDVINDPKYKLVEFPVPAGTAYKVISVRGHILLLTATGLYFFANLASRFLREELITEYTTVPFIPVEAIDFNVAYGKWVLIVTSREVIRFELSQLLTDEEELLPNNTGRHIRPQFIQPSTYQIPFEPTEEPVWTERSLDTSLLLMGV